MPARTSFGQSTLARKYFSSDEIFRSERERIFSRSWLLAGHISRIEGPGRYFLFELDRESVIVLRDANGTVRAFHNHCRHRGSRLCQHESGALGAAIQCPYHAWTYALDGTLRSVPAMIDVPSFDAAEFPLHRVALEMWHGFVFVNLDPQPVPFATALPALAGRFAHRQLAQLESVHQQVYDVAANWKLLFHNFSECYHCPTVHPLLNALTPFRNSENDLDDGPVLGGPMTMSNAQGSMTIGGERCARPFAALSAHERARVYYYTILPSAFVSLHPDYVLVHRVQALAIDHTRVVCDWYFEREATVAAGFDPQPAIAFWDLTNRQDWELCANAHRGVTSLAWQPGPYTELESQAAAFDREYLRAMAQPKALETIRV